jgi:hypothetical protein
LSKILDKLNIPRAGLSLKTSQRGLTRTNSVTVSPAKISEGVTFLLETSVEFQKHIGFKGGSATKTESAVLSETTLCNSRDFPEIEEFRKHTDKLWALIDATESESPLCNAAEGSIASGDI